MPIKVSHFSAEKQAGRGAYVVGSRSAGKSNLLFLLVGIIGVAAGIWTGSLFHLIVWCFLLAIAVMELVSPTKLEER